VATRFLSWGWVLFNGIVTFLLGILILNGFPGTALWVIGLYIGIDMILAGWSRVMLALSVRSLPS
jgi:uncharacterized membrane protein HdeD (DUF308 family)